MLRIARSQEASLLARQSCKKEQTLACMFALHGCFQFECFSVSFRQNVIGIGVEDEDRKHTWIEDAEAVKSSN